MAGCDLTGALGFISRLGRADDRCPIEVGLYPIEVEAQPDDPVGLKCFPFEDPGAVE